MKWKLSLSFAAVGMILASCGTAAPVRDVNKPIAEATVKTKPAWNDIRRIIETFSKENHFAIQENVTAPQGMIDFNVRLFRDDISIVIDKLHDEPAHVAAYPLCTCELNHRIGLQDAADTSVKDLSKRLSEE